MSYDYAVSKSDSALKSEMKKIKGFLYANMKS